MVHEPPPTGTCSDSSPRLCVIPWDGQPIAIGIRPPAISHLFLAAFPARNPKSKVPRPDEHCQGGGSGRRGHDLDRRRRAVQWTERFAPEPAPIGSLRPNSALRESGLAREMADLAFYRVRLRSHCRAKGVSGGCRTWVVCYAFQTHR
jgi:hypothetical protein